MTALPAPDSPEDPPFLEAVRAPQPVLSMDAADAAHYVHYHLGIPLVRRITLRNEGDADLEAAKIRLRPVPEFAPPIEFRVERVAPGEAVEWNVPDLHLDGGFLAKQTEQQRGQLEVQLFLTEAEADADAARDDPMQAPGGLTELKREIAILAFSQWPGLNDLPELLAAYVTPNLTCISAALHDASRYLAESTGSGALNGYQSGDAVRVLRIVEAVFRAVQARQITYVNPPPSYDTNGQKVRFAEVVWQGRQGACLDLALFFASALEAAGLHPLICVEKGHAYAGCWLLEDRLFDLAFQDDVQALRKGADLQTLCVFETTLVDQPSATFATAEKVGRARLENDSDFRWALDVARARSRRVRPLPLALEDGRLFIAPAPVQATTSAAAGEELEERFRILERDTVVDAEARRNEPPDARIARWQRQLLDLSLRNRLLNLQERSCVRLLPGDLGALEDHLADAGEVRMLEKPEADARVGDLHVQRTGEVLTKAELTADLANHKLRTDETKAELLRKLTKLERESQVALDESGSNTLFLALGILEWREHPGPSAKVRLAPLLLVPVHLSRRSVRSGFRLRRRDEETQINITLLEKLKREFGIEVPGIDPPPLDDAGVDVELVLQRMRRAVVDVPGFEVREEAFLGPFSFTKFLLWKDLSSRLDDLKRNPVVAHLVDHWGTPFPTEVEFLLPEELDAALPPQESFHVLEADSSQLAAVGNASRGQHFVLNGPPGTGKSQTIANVIAQCMALGRSVLFVAEKKTALEVVQRRLEKIGLGPFCLELHSNKTGKTEFVRQLREAVDFGGDSSPQEWAATVEELERSRDHLNGFVDALHRRCPNGLSPYACFGILIPAGGREATRIGLTLPDPVAQTAVERLRLKELIEVIAQRLEHFPDAASHPLRPLGAAAFTLSWEAETAEKLSLLQAAPDPFRQACAEAAGALKLDVVPRTAAQFSAFVDLCALLRELPALRAAALRPGDARKLHREVSAALKTARAYHAAVARLGGYDTERLLDLDLRALQQQWQALEPKFALLRWLGRRKLIAQLTPTTKGPSKLAPGAVAELLEDALALAAARAQWEKANAAMEPLLGELWQDGAPDEATVQEALQWLDDYDAALAALAGDDFMAIAHCRDRIAVVADQAREWLRAEQAGGSKLIAVSAAWETLLKRRDAINQPGVLDLGWEGHPDLLPDLDALIAGVLAHRSEWQRWTLLQVSLREAEESGLKPLSDALLDGTVARHRAGETFDRSYAWETLRRILDREPILLNFFGEEHERAVDRFRKLDASLVDLNRKIVVARVASRRPQGLHDQRAMGEIAILRGELARQRRLKPVRALLSEIPTTLRRLKPCALMSPLSVAQYLDAGQAPFDVVIFDEASQIPVCDAIGALARGTQTIVAGDPRQLPPTAFFQKVDLELEEEDLPGQPLPPDQESILDECLAAQIPEHHLSWHYRSQRESLIAFSNQHYYGNRLLTFPAPEATECGVFFHPVPEGFYDRGRSRTNRAEAEAVVAAVREHVLDPVRAGSSLAVITFNTEQMTLIENLLDAARDADAAFDEAIRACTSSEVEEPFKVRNLESIQGDQRDVIFFSITYGPDRSGYVSHNFGPINKPGGERRLNVAVTRAKHEVHVFSTLHSGHIDLRRTGARGVLDLKNYLHFAEFGIEALAKSAAAPSEHDYDSEFEQFVAESLRAQGWTVHTQVGCSGYRIDLAVVDPDDPGRYLAGVECDGASYHRAATARDRDRLRQSFLEHLGWRIVRLWSTDWFRAPQQETERLHRRLSALQNEVVPKKSPARVDLRVEEERPEVLASHAAISVASPNPPPAASAEPTAPDYPTYTPARLDAAGHEREQFLEPAAKERVRAQVLAVLNAEAPISESLLVERVRLAWGFKRSGGRIVETVLACLPQGIRRTQQAGKTFLWRDDQDPPAFAEFRGSDPDDPGRRKLDDIPPEELSAAMAWLIDRFVSAHEDDLLRETAAIFGWRSLTSTARDTLQPALAQLLIDGFVRADDGTIRARS